MISQKVHFIPESVFFESHNKRERGAGEIEILKCILGYISLTCLFNPFDSTAPGPTPWEEKYMLSISSVLWGVGRGLSGTGLSGTRTEPESGSLGAFLALHHLTL